MAHKEPVQRYRYYDTPDGHDTVKKLWCVLRNTIPAAGGIALLDVLLWSHPKGYAATAIRATAVAAPVVGIVSTFVLATNGLASIRNKDDRLNWFLGGFIAGSCFGLWRRNRLFGFNMGMLGAILAVCRKDSLIEGWGVAPKKIRIRDGGATSVLADYSWTSERPRNWTTGET